MRIAAAIITYNEERNISRCIESLRNVVEEIVVVDSNSSDRTVEICRSMGAKVITHPFEGHIQQKNFALQQITSPWILSLDADEELSPQLINSIVSLEEGHADGYSMNRLTNYCGHWVRHCGWYPDTKLRLVRNGAAQWTGINPHDRLELKENRKTGHLAGDILHYSYYTREDHLKQIEYFSSIAARELHKHGMKSSAVLISIKVMAQFVKSFFIRLGFLDGMTGFTISRLSAFATYRKYTKLKLLNAGREI